MSDVPENAPEHCPGTQSDDAGKATPCAGCPNQKICASGEAKQVEQGLDEIAERMASIKHKILVLSGKGGVGKSTMSATLARALAAMDREKQVALLDIDICGPSQPRVMGVETATVHQSGSGWSPIYVEPNLCVMSIGFLLGKKNDAVIWRGPRKNGLIKQFLKDVDWGDIDYLVVDTPPGTSDEHISIVQYLLQTTTLDGALLVTTPQEVSLLDVRKEASFCVKTKVPILGVVENMSGFICPCCNTETQLFPATTGGAQAMAAEMNIQFLGKISLDPRIGSCMDEGVNFLDKHGDTPVAKQYLELARKIATVCENNAQERMDDDSSAIGNNQNGGGCNGCSSGGGCGKKGGCGGC